MDGTDQRPEALDDDMANQMRLRQKGPAGALRIFLTLAVVAIAVMGVLIVIAAVVGLRNGALGDAVGLGREVVTSSAFIRG